MPKQQSDDSILVSTARALGATLGRVKRLTTEGAKEITRKRTSKPGSRGTQARSAKMQSSPSSSKKRAASGKRRKSSRPRATAQAGASRSSRPTGSSRRGKSRAKQSRSRRVSRRG